LALDLRMDVEQIYTSRVINSGEARNLITPLVNEDPPVSKGRVHASNQEVPT
jgi:hypothetical protein